MTKFVFDTATTVNGWIADKQNSLAWLFAAAGGTEPDPDLLPQAATVLVEGSTTYEWVLAESDILAHPEKWTDFHGDRPTFVFTTRDLPVPDGADVRFVSGPVADALPAIRAAAGDGDVWLIGGGELVGQFFDAGALDEVALSVAPVALDGGAPLLPRRIESDRMRLVSASAHGQFARLIYAITPDPPVPADAYVGDTEVRAEWDRCYEERGQLWSGRPNGALVTEVVGLPPGRVLDVGCGEGADAVWLARQGWDVTGLEVSGVALARAAAHAVDAGVTVRWIHAGLAEADLSPGSFDLVSAQYPALLRTADASAEQALLAAVAPGGVLLLVHHAGFDTRPAHDSGFDPADYVWLSMIADMLDDDWNVELDEQRPRVAPDGGAGAHTTDQVLRARRLR